MKIKNRYKEVIIKWLNIVKLNAYRFFILEDFIEYRINMGCQELSIGNYGISGKIQVDIHYIDAFGWNRYFVTPLMKFYINLLYICGIEKIITTRIEKLHEN